MVKIPISDLKEEAGDSGVQFFNGQIQGEEYNKNLMGRRGLDIYDEMRKNDATVKASLKAIKLPIKSAEYRVDAASDEAVDIDARDLIDASLFEFVDWKKFLGEALTHLEFGFTVFEMVIEPRYVKGKLRLALVKLGFRKQLSVYSWTQLDGTPGITQWLMNGKRVSIPLGKLIHIANEQEGDNYEGISILRTAYKHWKYKDKFYLIDAVGAENHALGIADIVVPSTATAQEKKDMETWAKQRRANETAYIMRPEGFEVGMMDMKSGGLKDMKFSVEHHDQQILKNVLAQFLGLQTGSRALSEDHSRLFILSVKEVAENIIYAIQTTAIKLVVDLNFTVKQYPVLSVGDIDDENIAKVTEGIKVAVEAGILHPRSVDENVVRKMLSLPEVAIKELDKAFAKDEAKTPKPIAGSEQPADDLRQLRASIETALYEDRQAA